MISKARKILYKKGVFSGRDVGRVRKVLGWSQQRIADVIGVHQSQISRWEREVSPVPHWVRISLLAGLHEDEMKGKKR